MTIGITTGKIHFCENIYSLPDKDKYFFTIKFECHTMFIPHNSIRVYLQDSIEKSIENVRILRRHFALNHIYNDSEASIIFNDNSIIAIGTNGADNYLDALDDFKAKKFSELGINVSSLIIKA